MRTGEELYDELVRVRCPGEAVRRLGSSELVRLLKRVTELPDGGVPLLVGAVVDEEMQRRWLADTDGGEVKQQPEI